MQCLFSGLASCSTSPAIRSKFAPSLIGSCASPKYDQIDKKMENSGRTSATGRFQDFAAHVIGVSWLGERSILAPDTDTAAAISPSPQTSPPDPPFTRTVSTSRWRCLLSTRAGLISQARSEGAPIGRTLIDPGGGN